MMWGREKATSMLEAAGFDVKARGEAVTRAFTGRGHGLRHLQRLLCVPPSSVGRMDRQIYVEAFGGYRERDRF